MEPGPLGRLPEEWEAWAVAHGAAAYRGRQIFQWIQRRGVVIPEAMSDLPAALRRALGEEQLGFPFTVHRAHEAADGTRKLLLRLRHAVPGAAAPPPEDIETVLIPQLRDRDPDRDDEPEEVLVGRVPGDRVTQCISSQVGCAMGCVFCASGLAGLKRSLRAEEIVGQVLLGRSLLAEARSSLAATLATATSVPPAAQDVASAARLSNVVFMGMGEPLHNYAAVARALRLLTHPDGLALSTRRVTVSTSGLVPEIDRLGRDFGGKVQLAISLHATNDTQRSALMPINRRYPLADLMAALRRYPLPKRRRITIEFTLLRGVNDSLAEARALAQLLRGMAVKVNLIPMNPVAESALTAPDQGVVDAFRNALQAQGITCLVRTQRGDDIAAACGQLALRTATGERAPVRIRVGKAGAVRT